MGAVTVDKDNSITVPSFKKRIIRLFETRQYKYEGKKCSFQSKGILNMVELKCAETLCPIGVLNVTTICLSFK